MEPSVKEPLAESPVIYDNLDGNYIFSNNVEELFKIYEKIINEFNSNEEKYEINNVVGVIGKRGSGKTSFLLSIMNSLKNRDFLENYAPLKGVFAIDTLIEPRYFNKKVTILKLVLAKLFSVYKKDYEDNPSIDSEALNSCFLSLSSLTNYLVSHDNMDDEMGELDQLSDYLDIKKKFEELFEEFLAFENKVNRAEGKGTDKDYTTIAFFIDDLDMDSENGYSMISDISKYLKVKNLLITLAYDRSTMESLIFLEKMEEFGLPKRKENLDSWEKYFPIDQKECKDSSSQYLLKLIPLDNQIDLKPKEESNDELIQLIFNILLEKPDFNILRLQKDEKYSDVFELLGGINNLRLINQTYNLILNINPKLELNFSKAISWPDFSRNKEKIIKAVSVLINVPYKMIVLDGFEISSAMFIPKKEKAIALLNQCILICLYFDAIYPHFGEKLENDTPGFGQFLRESGVLASNDETTILYPKNDIDFDQIDLLDCEEKYNIEPLAFFELISKLNKLKNSKMNSNRLLQQYLSILNCYFGKDSYSTSSSQHINAEKVNSFIKLFKPSEKKGKSSPKSIKGESILTKIER